MAAGMDEAHQAAAVYDAVTKQSGESCIGRAILVAAKKPQAN
jgi:hypothetical protein